MNEWAVIIVALAGSPKDKQELNDEGAIVAS